MIKKRAEKNKIKTKRFCVISIFPEIIEAYIKESIIAKAIDRKLVKVDTYDPRMFTTDKHHQVDDRPFGGGPGMVLKFEPIAKAVFKSLADGGIIKKIKAKNKEEQVQIAEYDKRRVRVILLAAKGKILDKRMVERLAKCDQLILISGRYEGVDERVAKYIADEEVSVGDFVLTGGELPALTVIDSVSRQIPFVLGKYESLEEKKGSYAVYTRPEKVRVWSKKLKKSKELKVPKELLSGNHSNINKWRKDNEFNFKNNQN